VINLFDSSSLVPYFMGVASSVLTISDCVCSSNTPGCRLYVL